MQSPNKNLQNVKLRAIARGLGATLTGETDRNYTIFRWDKFLAAEVVWGGWRKENRITFKAYHPYMLHDRPIITVAQTRQVSAIVRDVQNRFVGDAREFCRKAEEMKRKSEAQSLALRNLVTSYLDELGADYDDAKKNGARNHSGDFSARGVTLCSYSLQRNHPTVEIQCSSHCLRHILRLVREDYEFHQSIKS